MPDWRGMLAANPAAQGMLSPDGLTGQLYPWPDGSWHPVPPPQLAPASPVKPTAGPHGPNDAGVMSDAERYSQMAGRGTADASFGNIFGALTMGAMSGFTPMMLGAGEALQMAGLPGLGMAMPDYTGSSPITNNPRNLTEYLHGVEQSRHDLMVRNAMALANPLSGLGGGPAGGARRSGTGGRGGRYGGSYGRGDRTSVGPGGTLGHI